MPLYKNLSHLRVVKLGLPFVTAASLISACGTAYKVHNVKPEELANNPKAGLYYFLPRTEVFIEAIATGTKPEYGEFSNSDKPLILGSITTRGGKILETYGEVLEHNRQTCGTAGQIVVLGKSNRVTSPDSNNPDYDDHDYTVSEFSMTTETVADSKHLYRLDIDPSALASFSHKIVVNESGVISAATSTVTDAVSPFIYNSVKSFAGLASGAAALNATTYCDELAKTERFIKSKDEKLEELKNERIAVVDNVQPHVDGKAFEIKLKLLDESISNFKKKIEEEEAKFGVKTHKVTYVVVSKLNPSDFQSNVLKTPQWAVYKPKFETKDDDTTPKRISFLPGKATTTLDRLQKPEGKLTKLLNTMTVSFDSSEPEVKTCSQNDTDCKDRQHKVYQGYKYRIPKTSQMTIRTDSTIMASTDIQVAQFGSVVPLPEKFFGSKGTVDLAFNPNTGGLTSATIGADPISSTAVSQYVDVVKSYKDAETAQRTTEGAEEKAKAATEAARVASEARADIDAALQEIERLEALKKLRDLRIELGLPVE